MYTQWVVGVNNQTRLFEHIDPGMFESSILGGVRAESKVNWANLDH